MRWVFRFAMLSLFLALFVASHVLPSLALATGAALRALTGIPTLAVSSTNRLEKAEKDLEIERLRNRNLSERLQAADTRASGFQRQLASERRKTADLQRQLQTPTRASTEARARALDLMQSVSDRTKRVAAANAGSMVGEAIPFYGIGIIVVATGYELHVACENMKDIAELAKLLDEDDRIAEDAASVCGTELPSREDIWTTIKTSPAEAWSASVDGLAASRDWAVSLETPDFGGLWNRATALFDR